eukprot:XP_011449906.1 PREDICTED: uncharacterized protein LOC105344031 [Crassostrea gigas]
MTICFVFNCNHQGLKRTCKMFRFPTNATLARRWEKLCRRKDRSINASSDRICSCHFKDGVKDNGPTIFSWSSVFDFEDPNKISRRTVKAEAAPQEICVSTLDVNNCAPQLPPHSHDHSYQLTFERMIEEHKNLKLQVKELTDRIQAISLKRAFTLEDIIGDERKCLLIKMD